MFSVQCLTRATLTWQLHYSCVNLTHEGWKLCKRAHLFACLPLCACVWWRTCVLSHVRDMTARRWLQMRTRERGGREVQTHKHTGDETSYIDAGTLDIYTLLILLHVHSSTELLGSCRATGPNVTDSEAWEWRRWSRPLLSVLMCRTEKSPLHTSLKSIGNASDVAMAMTKHRYQTVSFFLKGINLRRTKRTIRHGQ